MEPELSQEQEDVIEAILGNSAKMIQSLGGYAGTGKTTVIRALTERLQFHQACAFTGKAVSVLRKKGVKASTIHSLIYHPVEHVWRDEKGVLHKTVTYDLKTYEEFKKYHDIRGFIVDESSMVSRQLYNDMISFGLPIIFVGDHGQLPPVSDDKFSPMKNPEYTLETIHRNAGEIAYFSELIRKGNPSWDWWKHEKRNGSQVSLVRKSQFSRSLNWKDKETQMICAFNRSRVRWNRKARQDMGMPEDVPVCGDKIICLQNHREKGLFNGMQGYVTMLNIPKQALEFSVEEKTYSVTYNPDQFNQQKASEFRRTGWLDFDYAYCLTCHKSQGSEWDHVIVLEERLPSHVQHWEHPRWAYTAASRARKTLTWLW